MESMEFVTRKEERGFTLVELAIVMIIIGLLIGGILKGQELITNARIASTISQVKGIDAATSTFDDKYDGMPGDLANAATRLVNCAGLCAPAGATVGNGILGGVAGAGGLAGAAPGVENQAFFLQLNAADLMQGINPNLANANTTWGGNYPEAEIAGGFQAGYLAGGAAAAAMQGIAAANIRAGHYVTLNNAPGAAMPATGILTPNHAFRIDEKLDDGSPVSGSIFPAGAAACVNGNAYNESVDATNCNLYIRFHQ